MPTIVVRPSGLRIEAGVGATIMEAAWGQDLYWPTTCGGECRCTTCAVVVLRGVENLSPMGRAEARTLSQERGPAALNNGLRLACQARVLGDVEVHKPGVRPNSA